MKYPITILLFLTTFIFTPPLVHAQGAGQVRQMQKLQEGMQVDKRFSDYINRLLKAPKDPQIHLALAQAYSDNGLYELAIISFKRALALQPDLAQAHRGLSQVYRKKKLKDWELQEMIWAVEKDPQNWDYHYHLGVLYMEPANFDYKKAKKEYKTLQKNESPLAAKLGAIMEIE